MLKFRSQVVGIVLLCTLAGACGQPLMVRMAEANRQLAASGKRLGAYVEEQHQLGQLPQEQYDLWKARLMTAGKIGRLITEALMRGDKGDVVVQLDAFTELIDQLIAENVVKLKPDQKTWVLIILESVRTTTLIFSVSLGS